MSLSPSERLALDRIESALKREDPDLASLLSDRPLPGRGPLGRRRGRARVWLALFAAYLLGGLLVVAGVAVAAEPVAYAGLLVLLASPWVAVAYLLRRRTGTV